MKKTLILVFIYASAFADNVDRSKLITLESNIVTFTAWEGTLMRMPIADAIDLGVVTNGWGGFFTNAQETISRKLPENLAPIASAYRATLQSIFGVGAETNRQVTADAVFGYFFGKAVSKTMTDDDRNKKDILQNAFGVLSAWNGTGETWTLPWEVVP